MQEPPIPVDEKQRLAALRGLEVLDTPPEERFDRLTRLARTLFEVPIALVSLVDDDRQWFKSRQGLDACEMPRGISFCGHTIAGSEILMVPDTLEDERFVDNPLVTGVPYLRFYAGAPLTTAEGQQVGTLCIVDHRPRHLGEEELRSLRDLADCAQDELAKASLIAAREEAEESRRMMSDFCDMMSHELRTPLTVILGYLPLFMTVESMPPAETIAEATRDMKKAGDHLLQVLNDLLDLSKIESGSFELKRENTDLSQLVEEVIGQLAKVVERKGLGLLCHGARIKAFVDPLRLRQVLINLLDNAIKFTERGSISVETRESGEKIVLRIQDTGIGIAADDLPSIFDRFKQVDGSSTRNAGGSGLGLAITRSLVEMHGGRIEVGSRLGEGSVFTITLDRESAP